MRALDGGVLTVAGAKLVRIPLKRHATIHIHARLQRVIIEELAALTEVKKKPSPKGSGGKRKPSPKGKGSASSGLAPPSPQTEEKTTAKLALTDIATEAYKERKRLTSVTPLVGGSSSVGAGEAVEPAVSLPPRPSSIPPPGVDIHSPPSAAATGATMGASASAFSPFPLGGMGNGAGAGLTTNSGFNGLQNSINANPLFLAALSAAASSAANPFAAGLPQGYAAMGAAAAGMGLAMGGWGSPFAQQLFPLGGGFNPLLYANAYGAYLAAQQQQAQQQQAQQQAALQLAPSSLPFQLPSPSTLQQPQPPQPLQPQKKQPKRPKQQQPQPPPPKQEEVMPSMPKAEPLPLPLPRAKPQELLVDIARAESSSPFPFFETSPFEQPKKKARKQSQQQGKEKAAAAAETRTAALTGGGAPAAIKPLPPLSAIAVEAPEAATLEMGEKRESPGSVHVPPSTPPLLEEQEGAKGGGEQKAEAFAKEGSPAGKEGKELEPRGQEKGNGKGQEQGQVGTDAGRGMKRMEGGKVVFDEAAFWM